MSTFAVMSRKEVLSVPERTEIQIQKTIAWASGPLIYLLVAAWMKYVRGYKVERIRDIRREFDELNQSHPGPWIICANHLTLIDSFILIWALGTPWRYFFHPHLFAWNLPEKMNFYHNPASRLLCYLGKCIPVVRGGSRETAHNTRKKIHFVLEKGESLMIFPEGTRSRSGRIEPESVSYAIGDLVLNSPQASILCVYLRGVNQKTFGNYPARHERFKIKLERVEVRSSSSGLRAQRELSIQVISKLKQMEEQFFERSDLYRK